jgi:hypothetical protein
MKRVVSLVLIALALCMGSAWAKGGSDSGAKSGIPTID